jgi:hypothetical protein
MAKDTSTDVAAPNASPAPGLLERREVSGETYAITRDLVRDEDVLSSSFRADLDALVSPLAVIGAVALLLFSIRSASKRQDAGSERRQAPPPQGAADAP